MQEVNQDRFPRILRPIDFSELAAHATRIAHALAERSGATWHVPCACQPLVPTESTAEFGLGLVALLPAPAALRYELDAFVRRVCGHARVPLVTAVRTDRPVRVIAEYTNEMDIDPIVIGTRGRGRLLRLLRGSVSTSVREHADCTAPMVPPTAGASADALHDPAALVAAGRGNGAL